MRPQALALLALAVIGCGPTGPLESAEGGTRSPADARVRLDNEEQAVAYEARIARLSCEELVEHVVDAEQLKHELQALEPRAWSGGVQAALVKRALACDGDLPALLVYRYLPHVIQEQ